MEVDPLLGPLRRLGRYTDIEPVARGGMGRIYRANDTQMGRPVAIKVLSPEARRNTQAVVRFQEEIRAACNLRDTHVVTVYDSGDVGDTLYYTMEYVDGTPLDEYVEMMEPPLRDRVALVVSIARGVGAMHAADILHRDLKPENVMVDERGVPVIIDLGVAKRISATDRSIETMPGTSIGTPLYMPPEQVRYDAERIGKGSDVYGLGVLAYQILTGRFPYETANRALGLGCAIDESIEDDAVGLLFGDILEAPPIPPSSFDPAFPGGVEKILLRALAKDPEDRHADATAMADALERWLDPPGAGALPSSRRRKRSSAVARAEATPTGHRWAFVLAATAVGLALVLGAIVAASRSSGPPEEVPAGAGGLAARRAFAASLAEDPATGWEFWRDSPDRDPALDQPFRRLALGAAVHAARLPGDEGLAALRSDVVRRLENDREGAGFLAAADTYLAQLARLQTMAAEAHLARRDHARIYGELRPILDYRPEHVEHVLAGEESLSGEVLTRLGWAVVDVAIAEGRPPGAFDPALRLYQRARVVGDAFSDRDRGLALLLLGRIEEAGAVLDGAYAADFLLPAARAWQALAAGDPEPARSLARSREPRWLGHLVLGLLHESEGDPAAAVVELERARQSAWYLSPLIEQHLEACR